MVIFRGTPWHLRKREAAMLRQGPFVYDDETQQWHLSRGFLVGYAVIFIIGLFLHMRLL